MNNLTTPIGKIDCAESQRKKCWASFAEYLVCVPLFDPPKIWETRIWNDTIRREGKPMNKPTKEECRLASNEDQKSFQRLNTYEQKLLTKYCEHVQALLTSGQWVERYNPLSDAFNPGSIYRLDPAAAEPEGPSDEELELCRNPLMRVLAAMPECTETLKKWPRHVQFVAEDGKWTYYGSISINPNPGLTYRLVKEPFCKN